jgi:hypothetical protein
VTGPYARNNEHPPQKVTRLPEVGEEDLTTKGTKEEQKRHKGKR